MLLQHPWALVMSNSLPASSPKSSYSVCLRGGHVHRAAWGTNEGKGRQCCPAWCMPAPSPASSGLSRFMQRAEEDLLEEFLKIWLNYPYQGFSFYFSTTKNSTGEGRKEFVWKFGGWCSQLRGSRGLLLPSVEGWGGKEDVKHLWLIVTLNLAPLVEHPRHPQPAPVLLTKDTSLLWEKRFLLAQAAGYFPLLERNWEAACLFLRAWAAFLSSGQVNKENKIHA